jgi:HEAT repeat protein
LRRVVDDDKAEDVVAAAEIAIGRLGGDGTKDFLVKQLDRDSRWWNSVRLGAILGLSKLSDASLAPVFERYTAPRWEPDLRLAAISAWESAAPEDPKLAAALRTLTSDRNRSVRLAAIQKLGKFHDPADTAAFEALSKDPDPNAAQSAKDALEDAKAFSAP